MVLNLSSGLSDSKLHAIPTIPVLLKLSVVQETVLCFVFLSQTHTWSDSA